MEDFICLQLKREKEKKWMEDIESKNLKKAVKELLALKKTWFS